MPQSDAAVVRMLGKPAPASRVVEELEKLLQQAKSGELRVLCYCGVMTERRVFHGCVEDDDGLTEFPAVMFALERLKIRMMTAYEERVEEGGIDG